MIDEGDPHFQTLRHAHKIGVAQECVQHITARFKVGNAVNGIQTTSAPEAIAKRIVGQFNNSCLWIAEQHVALPGSKYASREEIGMQEIPIAPSQVCQLAILIVGWCH